MTDKKDATSLIVNHQCKQRKFTVLDRKNCFRGFYQLDKLLIQHELFHGGMSNHLTRELFVRPDAVCVLAFDPQTDCVILLEQLRIGALDKSADPWLLEIIAGLIEDGETPEQVAKREAQEEAGLALVDLLPITSYYPSPGGSNERVHLFLGRCDSSTAADFAGLQTEDEDIKVHVIARSKALELMQQGKLDNAATLISMQWLQIHLARVLAVYINFLANC